MTQPSEQLRTAAGRALLTILRHRAQVATTEPCMAALIGAVDDAVRMLPKIEAEAAAPDPVASPAPLDTATLERALRVMGESDNRKGAVIVDPALAATTIAAAYRLLQDVDEYQSGQPVAEEPA